MPLEDLDEYGSDSGSSSQSRNSETAPKSPQHDSDSNATEAESIDRSGDEQRNDGRSDDSDQHTPAQKSKRRCSPAASSALDEDVGPSDSESILSERDELFGTKRYKCGFKRPRLVRELVSSWSKDHVSPDDIEGEIARIMAKSMHDAKVEVTPKYNARAISDFRLKTVRALPCELIPLCLYHS
jgi:hypothetical protein